MDPAHKTMRSACAARVSVLSDFLPRPSVARCDSNSSFVRLSAAKELLCTCIVASPRPSSAAMRACVRRRLDVASAAACCALIAPLSAAPPPLVVSSASRCRDWSSQSRVHRRLIHQQERTSFAAASRDILKATRLASRTVALSLSCAVRMLCSSAVAATTGGESGSSAWSVASASSKLSMVERSCASASRHALLVVRASASESAASPVAFSAAIWRSMAASWPCICPASGARSADSAAMLPARGAGL